MGNYTRFPSSSSGGGDATAANQVLEIADLDAIKASTASIDTKTPAVGQAAMVASSPVVIASNQTSIPVAATLQAGSAVIGHVINDAGSAIIGKVGIDQTTPGTTNLVALAANQSVNNAQVNGVTVSTGNGVSGTGVQRVAIASDNTAFPVNATLSAETTKVIGTVNIAASQTVGLVAGSAIVGKVGIDQTTPGTTNLVALAANQSVNVAQMNGVATTMGNGVAGTGVQRVVIASDNTSNTNPFLINQSQVNGVAMLAGNGVAGTGAQRVTIASDNTPFAVKIDQTTPGTTNLVALAANQSVNNAQIAGVATATGNGVVGTGVQRVAIASDNTAFSVNATLGTETTKVIGNVGVVPSAVSTNAMSSGASTALATNLVVKASAGRLYQLYITNTKTTVQFIQVHNTTSLPADTAVPIYTSYLQPLSTTCVDFGDLGRYFSTGITVCNSSTVATKTIGSADCWFNAEYL